MFKILVIEDNASNMKLTAFLLENAGYNVLKALDAETGIACAIKEIPDLILMDVQLPGMDGLQATRILKSNHLTQGIKIIAMTALVMEGDREKIIEAGCDGYVPKPIQYKEFLKLITDLLPSIA
jgi:two-component system cell cycle response regulator DivK